MCSFYDEDITENRYFNTMKNDYTDIFLKSIYEGCTFSIPRNDSISLKDITMEDILGHIFVPNHEMPESHFTTLNGKSLKIVNNNITLYYQPECDFSCSILFEETYYTEDLFKYKVLCIDQPLDPKSEVQCVLELRTLRDCIDVLWSQLADTSVMESLDLAISEFLIMDIASTNVSIENLAEQSQQLYVKCLRLILRDARLRERLNNNLHQYRIIKLAIETYIHHGIYKYLFREISSCTSGEDSLINKIIRNAADMQLQHMDIRPELYELIPKARSELSRIDGYSTVLGKLSCIRKVIGVLSGDASLNSSVSTDDLLPAIIFVVTKTSITNWYAHLKYLQHFHHSSESDSYTTDHEYLVTTLEACLEHIKTGLFFGITSPEGQNSPIPEIIAGDFKDEYSVVTKLFNEIVRGDLKGVVSILEPSGDAISSSVLCHPLCDCDKCSNTLKTPRFEKALVHSSDESGVTPLHIAAMYGKPGIVDYLLSHDADTESRDYNGYSALHYASSRGHQNTVLLLLQYGAEVNAIDNSHNTCLHLSAANGHEGCTKAIFYHCEHVGIKLNINSQNTNGDTPLHNAAKWGFLNIVRFLILNGANPLIKNRKRLSPFDVSNNPKISEIMAKSRKDTNVSQIERRVSFDLTDDTRKRSDDFGELPHTSDRMRRVNKLLKTISCGDVNLACYYLGLNPNKKDSKCHPLCSCDACNTPSILSSNETVKVNECNVDGYTPIHMASMHGHSDMVDILVRNGASIDARIRNKFYTPLILACQNHRVHTVKCLLDHGCNINAQDRKGNTALHHAVLMGNCQLVEILLSHNPNLGLKNKDGKSPQEEAESKMALSIMNVFRETKFGLAS